MNVAQLTAAADDPPVATGQKGRAPADNVGM